jgi:signal transduction histidine kinase
MSSFFNRLTYSGISKNLTDIQARKIVLTNRLCLILFFTSIPYIFVFYFMNLTFLSNLVILVIASFLGSIFCNKLNYYNLAKFGIITTTSVAIFFYSSSLGRDSGIQLLCLVLVVTPLVIFEFHEKIKIIIAGLIPIVTWVVLEVTNYSLVSKYDIQEMYLKIIYWAACFLIVTINILIVRFYFNSNQEAEEKLKKSIEELKNAYSDLKESKSAAEELARQSAYATLTRGIAHEIRNPLQMIYGRAELVLEDIENKESVEKFANVVIRNIKRLKKLLGSMLEYGTSSGEGKSVFSIKKILEDISELSQHKCKENGITMTHQLTKGLFVKGNKIFIYQAILNLVVNAIQYTSRGGFISLNSKYHVYKDKDGMERDGVEILVTDTGEGISKEIMKEIFVPYFTSKKVAENTGLGLSVSFKTITENDGLLEVESEKGFGTTFKVYLPLEDSETSQMEK